MNYYWKVWKWENGKKSTEYTKYLTAPIFIEPHLDETLGTGEIILDSMPIKTKQAFPPKTKFRIERYMANDFSDSPRKYDFVVDSDQVELYAGVPEICCHRIHLIEPSVIAQGMHVDNISLTRELNDIDLNYKTIVASDETVSVSKSEIIGSGYARPNTEYSIYTHTYGIQVGEKGTQHFTNSFRFVWENTESINNLLLNLNALDKTEITFKIPSLMCQFLNGSIVENLFECPVRTSITRMTLENNKPIQESEIIVIDQLYNPINIQQRNDWSMYNNGGKIGLTNVIDYDGKPIWLNGGGSMPSNWGILTKDEHMSKFPAMINTNDTSHS